jgi:hypothetical protein
MTWRRFAGVSAWAGLLHAAECNKAPFMYEMKGVLSGHAAPDRPVARPPRHRAPPAGARYPQEILVSQPFPRPRGCPRMVPVSNGENISTPSGRVAQEPAGIHSEFLSCPHIVHRIPSVIRTSRRLSTGLCTSRPQVTWRNSENTSAWWPYVIAGLSRRRSVDHPMLELAAGLGSLPASGAGHSRPRRR